MLNSVIDRYRQMRNLRWLRDTYTGKYAFVGIGSHSVMNLYPVLQYLQVPVKYICCKSAGKLPLIGRKFPGVTATTSLESILGDDEVQGIFVSASPSSHFHISSRVIESGKPLFVEKPVCHTLEQLHSLLGLATGQRPRIVTVGMQRRYAPITRILKKRLEGSGTVSYNYRYVTGPYPEGDALSELFIHPLDYVCCLFGPARIINHTCIRHRNGGMTLFITIEHTGISEKHAWATGIIELSSAYTWQNAWETLTVNSPQGIYTMQQMEELTILPHAMTICHLPVEKLFPLSPSFRQLYGRNNFVPSIPNNQLYTQGYFNEIKSFLDAVERGGHSSSSLETMLPTYQLMESLRKG